VSELREAYVVDYQRVPFSRSRPNEPSKDVYNSVRMDLALSMLIRKVVERNRIEPADIGDVITGCALQVDENWSYGGRHPVLLAELPVEVPSMAIDRACASSMNAVSIGAMEIISGNSDLVLAGGMEHMTHVPMSNNPHLTPNMRLLLRPEYQRYRMNVGYVMGLTAERLAEESGISREDMDVYSLESHRRASSALERGWFSGELMPMTVEVDNRQITVNSDQSIRKDTDIEQLRKLPPAFKQDGVITAGNSSPLNAGASLVLLMSEEKVRQTGVKPLSRVVSMGWAGVDPSVMGKGPVPASRKALEKAGMKTDGVDLWEINEAFAVVVLYAMRELGLDISQVNVNGGAIAIGHPLGASGARLVGTLSRQLAEGGKRFGIATLCVGGGQGFSMLLEKA
jgi:acetyl-CoA acetyltransferase family protein